MPIKIPTDLPAREVLESEGVPVIDADHAIRQDIRPLKVAVLNLMPLKEKTETQIARVLGATPLQIEMHLLALATHKPKNVDERHMIAFYHPWTQITDQKFDGLIVTGAPIEQLPFEDVDYWDELCQILDWSRTNVHGLFNLCWGAQAALNHFYKIPKYDLPQKAFGVFEHNVLNTASVLCRGLNDTLRIPVSRHTENRRVDFTKHPNLEILMEGPETGIALVHDHALNHVHMFNHLEYDSDTLAAEYQRDVARGDAIQMPAHYYPDDDPAKTPVNRWRAYAHILFGNWINMIYQSTPFDLHQIGESH
ncbi:MAG: homoserine O-succinyltransferase [Rhodospirillaceae bacterium]